VQKYWEVDLKENGGWTVLWWSYMHKPIIIDHNYVDVEKYGFMLIRNKSDLSNLSIPSD
jgi:hypothetical protein